MKTWQKITLSIVLMASVFLLVAGTDFPTTIRIKVGGGDAPAPGKVLVAVDSTGAVGWSNAAAGGSGVTAYSNLTDVTVSGLGVEPYPWQIPTWNPLSHTWTNSNGYLQLVNQNFTTIVVGGLTNPPEQTFVIITNASFGLTYLGTPTNGEILHVVVSNYNTTANSIYMTNSSYDTRIKAVATAYEIYPQSISSFTFVNRTNLNLGVARWELDGYVGAISASILMRTEDIVVTNGIVQTGGGTGITLSGALKFSGLGGNVLDDSGTTRVQIAKTNYVSIFGTNGSSGLTVGKDGDVSISGTPGNASLYMAASNGAGGISIQPSITLPVKITNYYAGSNFAPGQIWTVQSSNNYQIVWTASNAPAGGGGGLSGSGTAYKIPKWTGSTSLGDSSLTTDSGNTYLTYIPSAGDGSESGFRYTGAGPLSLPGEWNDVLWDFSATAQFQNNINMDSERAIYIKARHYDASGGGGGICTNGDTVYISGPPTGGTFQSITYPTPLRIASGLIRYLDPLTNGVLVRDSQGYVRALTNGAGAGKVLTSDANGAASWAASGSSSAVGGSGAIQFAEGTSFDGTNDMTFDRTNRFMRLFGNNGGKLIINNTNKSGFSNYLGSGYALVLSNSFEAPTNTVQEVGIRFAVNSFQTGTGATSSWQFGEQRYVPGINAVGTTNGNWVWQTRPTYNGVPTTNMTLSSSGALTANQTITAGSSFTTANNSGNGYTMTSRFNLGTGGADGKAKFTGNSATADFYSLFFGGADMTNSMIQIISSSTGTSNSTVNLRSGNTNHFLNVGVGSLDLSATNTGAGYVAPQSANSMMGAQLWSDGTNLCVVLQNSAGTRTTNKITMSAWP